jgi:hypothetical protein
MRTILTAAALITAAATGALLASPHTTTVQASPAPAYASCQEEDGSTPNQQFPCYWDAQTQGNHTGSSYVLVAPACTPYESALIEASHAQHDEVRLACAMALAR